MENEQELHSESAPSRRGRPRIYPFDELEQGEYCDIKGKRRDQIAPSMAAAERRAGIALFAFNIPEGVRVCRYIASQESNRLAQKAGIRARNARLKEMGLAKPRSPRKAKREQFRS